MDELKGIGHFTIWFLMGLGVFLFIKPTKRQQQNGLGFRSLYSPFLPFVFGTVAVVPYLLRAIGIVTEAQTTSHTFNVFMLYGLVNQIEVLVVLFRNFEIDAVLLGVGYLCLVVYYIVLIKRVRTYHAK